MKMVMLMAKRMRELAVVLLTSSVLVAQPANRALDAPVLPALGESVAVDMPLTVERRLGDAIMRDVYKDVSYFEDPVLQAYLQHLWEPLMQAAQIRGEVSEEALAAFAWQLFLIQNSSVNAFALPAGYIGVHLGLMALTTSADELVAVLAHELSHVTQRHIARNIARSKYQSVASVAATVLGLLLASRSSNGSMAQAAIVGSQAAMLQGQLNFSREMEREADRVGFGVMKDAGYAPAAMAHMFEKLDRANRFNDGNSYPYLRTHPLTVERIAEARTHADHSDGEIESITLIPKPNQELALYLHALMSARARWFMETSEAAQRRWMQDSVKPDASLLERVGALYLGAMAQLQADNPSEAQLKLEQMRRLVPFKNSVSSGNESMNELLQLTFRELQAKIYQGLGRHEAAFELWAASPVERSPSIRRAQMLLQAQSALLGFQKKQDLGKGNPTIPADQRVLKAMAEDFQWWLSQNPNDAAVWGQLAMIAQVLQRPLLAIRAEAESRALRFDFIGALDRLRSAQKLGREWARSHEGTNPEEVEMMVIDVRLRAFEEAQRQLKSTL